MGRSAKGIGTKAKTHQRGAAIGKVTDTRPRWYSMEKPKNKPRVLLDISGPFDDEFRLVLSDAQKRVGYSVFFAEVIQAPPRDEWLGRDGTPKYVMGEFNLTAGSRGVLVRVLDDVVQCAKGGVEYTGDTIAWIKDTLHTDGRSYYSLWIKPEAGLSAGAIISGRPPGNSSELMPWDTSLNKDVDDCDARHVAVGCGLKKGDLRYSTRLSRRTLREQTSSYRRVMDPAHLRRYKNIHSYTHRNY
jgi:hypothetical protein